MALEDDIVKLMRQQDHIRNIGIIAHIDHGKTTTTDNLLAGAGMISEELAGKQVFMDFDKQEQERGITIFAANASMIHDYNNEKYLVNLIDTPGHVDFGADVTRAMRAVDGAVVVVCAVEGPMPQTETVLRQALKERVRPVLFINKTDRLIRELKLGPEEMMKRLQNHINNVNSLILKYAEPEYREKWLVNVLDGTVAFGSAYKNWAMSVPYMKKTGVSFKEIIDMTNADEDKALGKKCPLSNVLLDMIVTHLPDPHQAQKYRVQRIWTGDPQTQVGQDMANCNAKGKLSAIITKVVPDPHAGVVCTSRLFSGTLRAGDEVYLVGQHRRQRVQQVSVYRGPRRLNVDEALAGNIIGIVGLGEAFSGETICGVEEDPIAPFESIKHIFEPVVTKSIEPKDVRDLPKLIDFLKQVNREDPSLEIKINEETGEYLVCGLGELHIDAKIERPLREKGIDIKSSNPIVVYRETIEKATPTPVEGKSPNKHNKFYIVVEPLSDGVFDLLSSGAIPEERLKKLKQEDFELFVKAGMDREEIKKYLDIYNKNILINSTKGIQYINETFEHIKNAFRDVCNEGPLAREPCLKLKVKVVDADLHEDAIHRGPAQVIPAVRQAIKEAILQSKPRILEPLQDIRIDTPEETTGPAMNEVQNRRGQVEDVSTELGASMIRTKIPVAEMFGFEGALKSATQGKGFYSLINVYFEKLPISLQEGVVAKIRARKGLTPEQA